MTQHSKPSQQQLAALRGLPQERGLLLQLQIRWPGEGAGTELVDLIAACQKTGAGILSQASVDLLAVGASDQHWSEICLLELPGPKSVEAFILTPALQSLLTQATEVEILLASLPHPRVQRVIRLLNRFMPWLPKPRAGNEMPGEELQGGINPSAEQFAAFEAADQRNTVHMFNLLRFHERARYVDGDRGRSGRNAYEGGYGKVAMSCFLRLGGCIVALGRYRLTLVGAGGDPAVDAWDELVVVQYPNRQAFVHMLSNPGYLKALEHRRAGLAETQLWSTTPRKEYCQA